MNLNFNRFFNAYIDFLIEIDSDKQHNVYSVPIGYLLRRLDIENLSGEFGDIFDDYGLIVEFEKEKIETLTNICEKSNLVVPELKSNQDPSNQNQNHFQTAYEILEAKEIPSKNSTENRETRENLNDYSSSNKKKNIIDIHDCDSGILTIHSMAMFIEKAAMYVDVEKIAQILTWKRFEQFISEILHILGFKTVTNFRFSVGKKSKTESFMVSKTTKKIQKRFEIDVVAIRDNKILFLDAKYYKPNVDHSATFAIAGEAQKSRAHIFSLDSDAIVKCFQLFGGNIEDKELSKIKKKKKKSEKQMKQQETSINNLKIMNKTAKNLHNYWVYPIILHSGLSERKLNYSGVPIVSFMHLSDFLTHFEENKNNFIQFRIKNLELQDKLL